MRITNSVRSIFNAFSLTGRRCRLIALLAAGLILAIAAHRSMGAVITFSAATTISGSNDVSTLGNASYAYDWNGSSGSATVNTVVFAGTTGTASAGTNVTLSGVTGGNSTATFITGTAAPATSLPTVYKNILDGADWTSAATAVTVTLNNLTSGHQYAAQVWVDDSRSTGTTRTETVSGGGNTVTLKYNSTTTGGLGQYTTGYFTAGASTQAFTLTGNASTQLNALQLRDLTNIGYWSGNANGTWDTSTNANFCTNVYSAAAAYGTFSAATGATNNVYFGDYYYNSGSTAAVANNSSVSIAAGGVSTGNVYFNNTALSYSVSSSDANGISGTTAVNVVGGGLVTLLGTHSYTGATTISAGTLQVGNGVAGSLGSGGNYAGAISNNGALVLNTGTNETFGGMISGTGNLIQLGPGMVTLTAANAYSGVTSVSAGTLNIAGPGTLGNGTYANSLAVNGVLNFSTTTGQNLQGAITGSGTLSQNNTNGIYLYMTGAMTGFQGTFLETAGVMNFAVAAGNGPASANLVVNGGQAQLGPNSGTGGTYAFGSLSGSGGSVSANSNAGVSGTYNLQVGGLNTTTTYAGVLQDKPGGAASTGVLALTKAGSGALTLGGSSTYSGGTSISAGTLQIGNGVAGSLGSGGNYAGAISNSGALVLNTGTNETFGGVISGTGNLTQAGNSRLTLGNANTFNGVTLINSGTLALNNAGALASSTLDTSGTGAVSFLGLTSGTVGGLQGTGNLALTNTGNTPIALSFGNNGFNNTYSGNLSGGTLVKVGAGTAVLAGSNSNSQMQVNGGVLAFSASTAIPVPGSILINSAGALRGDGPYTPAGWLASTYINTASSGALALSSSNAENLDFNTPGLTGLYLGSIGTNSYSGVLTPSGTTYRLGGSSGTLVITSSDGISAALVDAAGPVSRSLIVGGNVTLATNNTFTGNTTISSGTLNLANSLAVQNSTVIANSGLSFDTGVLSHSFTLGGLSGSANIPLTSGTNGVALSVGNNNANTTYSGALSSSGSLLKLGSGLLTLTGTNTHTGTTINQGVLVAANGSALGSGTVGVTAGAALQLSGNVTVANALTLNGTGVNNDGALRNISGTNFYSGSITLGSPVRINTDAGTLSLTGTVTNGANNLTIGGAGNTTVTGFLGSGAGGLIKDGGGLLAIASSQAYGGSTTLGAGTLQLGTTPALHQAMSNPVGAASTTYAGSLGRDFTVQSGKNIIVTQVGIWDLNSDGLAAAHAVTINGVTGGSATVPSGTSGTLSGGYRFQVLTSPPTLAAGTYRIWADNFSGTDSYPRSPTSLTTDAGSNGDLTFGTYYFGSAGLQPTSSDATSYPATSFKYYDPTSDINVNALASSTPVLIGSTGVLDLGGANQAVASLSDFAGGGGVVTNNSARGAAATLTLTASSGATTFSGTIGNGTGATALVLGGGGMLTLAGSNTYSGTTTINAGTLASGAVNALPTGTSLAINGGAFNLAGNNQQLATISGTGAIVSSAGSPALTIATSGSFAGAIQNGVSLVKTGAGLLTLSGSNTYNGPTTLSGGTLAIGSPGSVNTASTITVNVNGTLAIAQQAGVAKTNSNNLVLNGGTVVAAQDNIGTGGIINYGGGLVTHTFTASSTLNIPAAVTASELLVGAGGGAGGGNQFRGGGGGGGGQVWNLTGQPIGSGNITVTVGSGGSGGAKASSNTAAGNGTVGGATSISGGSSAAGGSGGVGAGNIASTGGAGGASGSTNAGGSGTSASPSFAGGGGGGAAGTGGNASATVSGAGGAGLANSAVVGLTVNSYGGGGAGGTSNAGGAVSAGGGGANGGAGTTNTGGGGGGGNGAGTSTGQVGGAGGSGFAIVQYAYNPIAAAGAVSLSGGTIDIQSPSILDAYGSGGTLTVADAILSSTGTGGVTIASSNSPGGVVVFSNTNTFAGNTSINSGATLALNSNLALQQSILDTASAGHITLGGGVTAPTLGGLINGGNLASLISAGYGNVTALNLSLASGAIASYSGAIADGAAGMTLNKLGAGTQMLSGSNTYTGSTTIGGGTLAIGGTGVLGGGNYAAAISNSGAFAYNSSSNQTFGGAISGNGSLAVGGAGVLTLNGVNSYSGPTTVNAGALIVNGTHSGGDAYTVAGGATLGGGGTISGTNSVTLSAGAKLAPGNNATTGSIGTLTLPSLTLGGGGTAYFDLSGSTTAGSGINDLVSVVGNLAISGTTSVALNLYNTAALANGQYALFSYGGTLSGYSPSSLSLANSSVLTIRQSYQFDNNSPGTIYLDVIGMAHNLTWIGSNAASWDNSGGTTNWTNDSAQPDQFVTGDNVSFPTSNSGTVAINSSVTPGSLTVSGTYTFAGPGKITSGTSLTVQSPAALTIANTNDYTLGTNLQGGSITLAINNGLPAAGALTLGTASSAGTLDLAGYSQMAGALGIGAGASAANQIITTSTGSSTLTFNSSTGSTSVFAGTIQDSPGTTGGTLGLTVAGGTLDVSGGSAVYRGATNINGGVLVAGALPNTSALAVNGGALWASSYNPALTLAVASGGTANISDSGLTLPGVSNSGSVNFTGSSGTITLNSVNGAGTTSFAAAAAISNVTGGTVNLNGPAGTIGTLTGAAVNLASGTTLSVTSENSNSQIAGQGGLAIGGTGTTTLAGSNNYSGATTLSGGIVNINANGALGTGNLTISGGSIDNTSAGSVALNNASQNWNADIYFLGSKSLSLGSGAIALGSSRTITIGANTLTIGGSISGSGYSLTTAGSGTLVLAGNSTFDGGMIVTSGSVNLQSGNSSSPAGRGTLTINSGATVTALADNQLGSEANGYLTALNLAGGVFNAWNYDHINSITFTGGTIGVASGASQVDGLDMHTFNAANPSILVNASSSQATITSKMTINSPLTVNVVDGAAASSLLMSAAIVGSNSLTKTGTGALILFGANTYSGSTTLSAGTLQLGNGTTGHDGSIASTSGVADNGTLVYNLFGNQTASYAISGSGSLSKSGTGTLTLSNVLGNKFSGGMTINAGQLVANGSGTDNGSYTLGTGTITINPGAKLAYNSFALSYDTQNRLILNSGTATQGNGSYDYVNNIALNNTAGGGSVWTLGTGHSVAGQGSALQSNIPIPSVTTSGSGNAITSAGSVLRGANFTVSPAGGAVGLTVSAVLADYGATHSTVSLTGGGIMKLTAPNSYSGGTTVAGGVLQLGNAAALGSTSGNLAVTGGTLDMNGFNVTAGSVSLSAGVILSSGTTSALTASGYSVQAGLISVNLTGVSATLTKSSTGTAILSGSNSYGGGTNVSNGLLQLGNSAALGSTSGNLAVTGGTLDMNGFNVTAGSVSLSAGAILSSGTTSTLSASGYNVQAGAISVNLGGNSATMAKSTTGIAILSGSNSYGGGTSLVDGLLQLGNSAALGSGGLAANGGTLDLAGFGVAVPSFSGAAGTITNSATNSVTFAVNQTIGTSFGGTLRDGAGPTALLKNGVGTLALLGSNTHSGGTSITGGMLQLGNSAALGTGGLAANGGTLDLNGFGVTVPSFSGTAGVVFSSGAGVTPLNVIQTGATTFGGSFQAGSSGGTVSLHLGGSGDMTLSGANTFGAAYVQNSATLTINGSITAEAVNVNLSAPGGAQLAGNGTINLTTSGDGLTYASSAASTFAGTIAGVSDGGVLINSGSLTLAGVNSYQGGTVVTGGLLVAANSAALGSGPVSIAGGTLDATSIAQSIYSLTMGSLGSLNLGIGNLLNSSAGTDNFGGTLNVLNFTSGTQELISYASHTGTFGSFTGIPSGYQLYYGASQLDIIVQAAGPATWAAAVSGNWSDSSKWIGAVPNAAATPAVINASATAAQTVTLDVPVTLGTLTLGNSGDTSLGYTISGSGTNGLTLDNSGSGAAIVVTDGTHEIDASMMLSDNLTVTPSSSAALTISGNISESGTRSLTLDGPGSLTLSGTNSFTGGATVSNGTLILNNREALADGTSLTVGDASRFAPAATVPSHASSPSLTIAPVPEPGTLAILLASIATGAWAARRRRRRIGSRE